MAIPPINASATSSVPMDMTADLENKQSILAVQFSKAREEMQTEMKRFLDKVFLLADDQSKSKICEDIQNLTLDQAEKAIPQIAVRLSRLFFPLKNEEVLHAASSLASLDHLKEIFRAVLPRICRKLVREDDLEGAIQLITTYEIKSEVKLHLLPAIAERLAEKGNLDRTLEIANKIPNARLRNNTLEKISKNLVSKEDFKGAFKIASNISDLCIKSNALQVISKDLLSKGRFEEAFEIADGILDGVIRDYTLRIIAHWLVSKDRCEEACKVADSISDECMKSSALRDISISLAEKDRFKDAIEIAEKISDQFEKGFALKGIAEVLVRKGHFEKAFELAQTISNEAARKWVLMSISTTQKARQRAPMQIDSSSSSSSST